MVGFLLFLLFLVLEELGILNFFYLEIGYEGLLSVGLGVMLFLDFVFGFIFMIGCCGDSFKELYLLVFIFWYYFFLYRFWFWLRNLFWLIGF